MTPQVQPLSHTHRVYFFYLLAAIFVTALPFLFLYATGYRFGFGEEGLVSTGGLYVAAERTGAQIYIDNELVRETRVFRRAFYAQGLDARTHRIHVQKEGHHTWVKELPVYPHLVTEAQSFNLPLTPKVRVISPWQTPSGVPILTATSSVFKSASTTNQYLLEPRVNTNLLQDSAEFVRLYEYFSTTTATSTTDILELARNAIGANATSTTADLASTTKEWRGVRLFIDEGDVYAAYVGNQEQMPYYYCAEPFDPYTPESSEIASTTASKSTKALANVAAAQDIDLELPVQSVTFETECDPVIKIDRGGEEVKYFDFFPNSTDLVIIATDSGAYVVEIDDRAWQNRQPLLLAEGLEFKVVNGSIYTYDEQNIYQINIDQNWF